MRGPYVFEEKDPNTKYKYSVGEWVKSNGLGSFWKIGEQLLMDRLPAYSVMFMSRDLSESGLRHIGDMSAIPEVEIRPLTDQRDILLCLASDIKLQEYKLLQQAKKLGIDFDALMRSRELIVSKNKGRKNE